MKKNTIILTLLVLAIIAIIVLINNSKPSDIITDETARCIASKSVLYASKTCSHCAVQKEILGNYSSYFNIIECTETPEQCASVGIQSIPAWMINGKLNIGVKTLKELKDLTNC